MVASKIGMVSLSDSCNGISHTDWQDNVLDCCHDNAVGLRKWWTGEKWDKVRSSDGRGGWLDRRGKLVSPLRQYKVLTQAGQPSNLIREMAPYAGQIIDSDVAIRMLRSNGYIFEM